MDGDNTSVRNTHIVLRSFEMILRPRRTARANATMHYLTALPSGSPSNLQRIRAPIPAHSSLNPRLQMLIHRLAYRNANADGETHVTTQTNIGPGYIRPSFISHFLRDISAGHTRGPLHRQAKRAGTARRALVLSDRSGHRASMLVSRTRRRQQPKGRDASTRSPRVGFGSATTCTATNGGNAAGCDRNEFSHTDESAALARCN